jgi:two-component system NtrC family response regulator
MALILVVDDDDRISRLLAEEFTRLGHRTLTAGSVAGARREAGAHQLDVVFLDVQLPDGSGLDIISELKDTPAKPEVIIFTGYGNPEGAEMAIMNGAWDYLEKPISLDRLHLALGRALAYRAQKKKAGQVAAVLERGGLLGDSPAMQACLNTVAEVAGSDASVLVWGETGAGKELVSRAIHLNSPRKEGAFVVVDCAALPENLVESLLFGHEKGAFTGAHSRATGLLAKAHGGSLFLDEVGELSLDIQRKLLRALQEHKFRPVGGGQEVESDFRVVAATNRDLDAMSAEGRFRPDLLYRLKGMSIRVPPLKERAQDIKTIASSFCAELCERSGIPSKGFAPDFFEALEAYDWPGNVRELKNTMEWVVARALDQPTLFRAHLPLNIRAKLARESVGEAAPPPGETERLEDDGQAFIPGLAVAPPEIVSQTLKDYRGIAAEAAEKIYLQALLKRHGAEPRQAQRMSGLSKARYYALLKKHQLSPEK